MSADKFTYVNIITRLGKPYEFTDIQDFQINVKSKMLVVRQPDGEFSFLLDNLRYGEVGLAPQDIQPNFQQMEVVLVPLPGQQPETLRFRDIINYDWKADNGLLMVFGKTMSLVFHIDQVISFQVLTYK